MKAEEVSYRTNCQSFRLTKFPFAVPTQKNAIVFRHLFAAGFLFAFVLCFALLDARAQQEQSFPDDVVPPPMKYLSKEEKLLLDAEQDVKKRTQLALNLMDVRLKTAETQTSASNFSEALSTLAGFQALLENTLGFLLKNDVESGKVQSNFKKFELSLRAQTPRIEIIRREMPSSYSYHVGKLIKTIRDARSKAIEPMFDDSVVPPQPQAQKKP